MRNNSYYREKKSGIVVKRGCFVRFSYELALWIPAINAGMPSFKMRISAESKVGAGNWLFVFVNAKPASQS
jgi:hypothetical protein